MAISTRVKEENLATPTDVTATQRALTDVISALAAFVNSRAPQKKVSVAENLKHAACRLAEAAHCELQRAELHLAVEALKTQGSVHEATLLQTVKV